MSDAVILLQERSRTSGLDDMREGNQAWLAEVLIMQGQGVWDEMFLQAIKTGLILLLSVLSITAQLHMFFSGAFL